MKNGFEMVKLFILRCICRDYEGPTVAPKVQAALDAAMLNVEPDIEVDVSALSSKTDAIRGHQVINSKGGGKTKKSNQPQREIAKCPKPRGLVPK